MSQPRILTLTDGAAEVVVAPDLGAGLASYDRVDEDYRTPLFRPCRNIAMAEPFALASNLLLPWSNRISGGGFHFAGRFHPLAPNLQVGPSPIHGNGFSSAWTVEAMSRASTELSLTSNGPGPFRYAARASYELRDGALTMRLTIANRGAEPLPFGLGFHPWIIRTPDTLLKAKADWVVLETSDHLPSDKAPVSTRPQWNFEVRRALPRGWINNAFLGWDGRAEIVLPDRKLALAVEADPPLKVFILFAFRRGELLLL